MKSVTRGLLSVAYNGLGLGGCFVLLRMGVIAVFWGWGQMVLGQVPGDVLGAFSTGEVVYATAAVDEEGNVYFGSRDGIFYSLDAQGQERWRFTGAGDWIESSAAIGPDGTVYFGCWDDYIYALNGGTGALLWRYQTYSLIIASPAVDAAGNIYIGSNDGLLYSLTPGGQLRWVFVADGEIDSSAALDEGGRVVFGDNSGTVYCLNAANGMEQWRLPLNGDNTVDPVQISTSPAVGVNGSFYVGVDNGVLYAISATGLEEWRFVATEAIDSSPVVGADGSIWFGSRDGYLYALDGAGLLQWDQFVGDVFYCSPALAANGEIVVAGYVGSGLTQVASFAADGSQVWEAFVAGYNDSSPVLTPDGSVWMGMHDGKMYRFAGNSVLSASSPWAKFRNNLKQDGQAGEGAGFEFESFFPEAVPLEGSWWEVLHWGRMDVRHFPWVYVEEAGWVYAAGLVGGNRQYFFASGSTWAIEVTAAQGYLFFMPESDWKWLW